MNTKDVGVPLKVECPDCGAVDFVYLDGYAFGDRMLESVLFMVKVDGKFTVLGVKKGHQEYFETLNTKMWLKECLDYCDDAYKQGELVCQCPKCEGDIILEHKIKGGKK